MPYIRDAPEAKPPLRNNDPGVRIDRSKNMDSFRDPLIDIGIGVRSTDWISLDFLALIVTVALMKHRHNLACHPSLHGDPWWAPKR